MTAEGSSGPVVGTRMLSSNSIYPFIFPMRIHGLNNRVTFDFLALGTLDFLANLYLKITMPISFIQHYSATAKCTGDSSPWHPYSNFER